MKKIIFQSLAIMLFLGINVGKSQAPEKVKNLFKLKFANATHVKWEKEGSKEFEASFMLNGKACSANFTAEGECVETEIPILLSELPDMVKDAFYSKYGKDRVIIAIAQIVQKNHPMQYEIEYKAGKKTKEALFTGKGEQL